MVRWSQREPRHLVQGRSLGQIIVALSVACLVACSPAEPPVSEASQDAMLQDASAPQRSSPDVGAERGDETGYERPEAAPVTPG